MLITRHCTLFLFLTLIANRESLAEEYYWKIYEGDVPYHLQEKQPSPELACRWLYQDNDKAWNYTSPVATEYESTWNCHMIFGRDPIDDSYGTVSIVRLGKACTDDRIFNKSSGQCEHQGIDNSCPSSIAGNPINFVTGYKLQAEKDFSVLTINSNANPLEFSRFYRSVEGLWTHSYSSRLSVEENLVALIHNDGSRSFFEKQGASYEPKSPETGKLVNQSNRWSYQSPNNRLLEFDEDGRLIKLLKSGNALNITYADKFVTVTDAFGATVEFTEDTKKQPLSVTADNIKIRYHYNEYKQLTSMVKTYPDRTEKKQYVYQDPKDSRLLTGITDERGVRYASWAYDERGRAISSEHSGGAEKISVSYNADGSSTVTNELGRKTRYTFELVKGVKRIKSIDGIPTANCPDSNSTFTYDDRGHLETKTDNNRNVTTYTHNDRGLETSRTEASGTPDSRTIVTEWHPTLFSPVRITEPDRLIQYTYDLQGRQLSNTVISR
jgi:hypothetical protein